jgi:DNA-binding transcriptional LysR family regulator
MQLESIRIFCDVIRCASFSVAARENGLSQSSVSQTVSGLESRLGLRLIDRSRRPLVPTEAGRLYYEGCRELIDRYQQVEDQVRALADQGEMAGRVRIAAIYSAGLHHLNQFSREFKTAHPKAEVRIDYLHPSEVVEAVLGDQVDLGLISCPSRSPEFETIPWREEEMVLAVHPDHPFASREAVELRELQDQPFVHFSPDLAIRRVIDRELRRLNVQVKVVSEFDNIEIIKRACEVPDGLAILPLPSLEREVKFGTLKAVPLKPATLKRPLAILLRKNRDLGLAALEFLKLLKAHADPYVPAPPIPDESAADSDRTEPPPAGSDEEATRLSRTPPPRVATATVTS